MLPVTSRTSALPPTIESCSSDALQPTPGAPRRSPSAPSPGRPSRLRASRSGRCVPPRTTTPGSIRTGSTISAPSTVASAIDATPPGLEQVAVGLEERLGLPGVPPPLDRSGDQLRPLVHHVLEGISQVVLARRAGVGGQACAEHPRRGVRDHGCSTDRCWPAWRPALTASPRSASSSRLRW